MASENGSRTDSCPLLGLPTELVDSILAFLSPIDLVSVSATCHQLHRLATAEIHWLHRVQANVPGVKLTTPYPCKTYQELYIAHDPRWFLTKHKIWFCDRELTGKLIVTRYDQRRGCIEGYQLVAFSNRTTSQHWLADSNVVIHTFEPQVRLHVDRSILHFPARLPGKPPASSSPTPPPRDGHDRSARFAAEVDADPARRRDGLFSTFMLARDMDADAAARGLASRFPYDYVWPPPAVPARHRVRAGWPESDHAPDPPQTRAEASDRAFRVRYYIDMAAVPPLPVRALTAVLGAYAAGRGRAAAGEVVTYATLDPELYAPTAHKPWRGVWVGDYSGHGCEFLLIHQPDDPPATDAELGLARGFDEPAAEWEARRRDARVHRGRLEAVKLTGDPNVPRGELTFVADDLGAGGFVGVANEEPFRGVRVVKSRGHVAERGFRNDKYIESQLLLISPNRLAQYWVGFGHISFFERVDIDKFLVP